jgi:tetratricopeptide (TPR) repeat protein
LHAVAWLGLGELLVRITPRLERQKATWNAKTLIGLSVAALAFLAAPTLMVVRANEGVFSDPQSARLAPLPGSPIAGNVYAWLARDGLTGHGLATLLPLSILVAAIWMLIRRTTNVADRGSIAFVLGPVIVALFAACFQIRGWSAFDGLIAVLALVVVSATKTRIPSRVPRFLWTTGVVMIGAFGLVLSRPQAAAKAPDAVTQTELESLVERNLAQWLGNRVGPGKAIVLAPPNVTTTLVFHGNARGLGTPFRGNIEGVSAALRIASATSPDEAHALVRRREVTHIVIPSWDRGLDEYARIGSNQSENALISLLHRWLPPRWLRPVPYQMPEIAGFEGQSVIVFEVVEVQENAIALSQLADYFVEMTLMDEAAAVARALEESYPEDMNALMARARVANAWEAHSSFAQLVEALSSNVSRGDDEYLLPVQRVNLAILLAEGKRFELSKTQVNRCFDELTEADWRSLTTLSLYRLLVLGKAFQLTIPDPSLAELARKLLPVEARAAL